MYDDCSWKEKAKEKALNYLESRKSKGKSGSVFDFYQQLGGLRVKKLRVPREEAPSLKYTTRFASRKETPYYEQALSILGLCMSSKKVPIPAEDFMLLAYIVREYCLLYGIAKINYNRVVEQYYDSSTISLKQIRGTDVVYFDRDTLSVKVKR